MRTLLLGVAIVLFTTDGFAKPNVIVFFSDDHGWPDLGCQGITKDVRTPHLDSLAKGGVRFTSGYVTAPQCTPSRAGILTGKSQNRFGVESNGRSLAGFARELTIAERLREAGYTTGMVGKWHLGPPHEIAQHGFQHVAYRGGHWTNFDRRGERVQVGTRGPKEYHIDADNAYARAFVEKHHENQFFLYVAYRAPHVPLDAPPKYLRRFPGKMPQRRRQALAMISAIDDGVGGVLEALRAKKIEDRTLIFFIGDNGAPLKIHKHDAPGGGPGWDGSINDPLNGEKGMLTEGGIRVPFLAYWKGKVPGARVVDHPVVSLDVAATALAMAGLPEDEKLDGVNLLPCLTGKSTAPPHEALYWRWIAQSAIREGRWKYLRGGEREYLFDLDADRSEKKNLLSTHPEIAKRLREKLTAWSQELSPPGLASGKMSEVWETYFDVYLDGKPAPPLRPRATSRKRDRTPRAQGWVLRNSRAKTTKRGWEVRPKGKTKRGGRPFIAFAGLDLPAKIEVVVDLRAEDSSTVGVAWRTKGQRDFPSDQTKSKPLANTSTGKRAALSVSAEKNVIHLRVHLPPEGATVERIEVRDERGKKLRSWSFVE